MSEKYLISCKERGRQLLAEANKIEENNSLILFNECCVEGFRLPEKIWKDDHFYSLDKSTRWIDKEKCIKIDFKYKHCKIEDLKIGDEILYCSDNSSIYRLIIDRKTKKRAYSSFYWVSDNMNNTDFVKILKEEEI